MKKNFTKTTKSIKKAMMSMAMAVVMGGTLLAQAPAAAITAQAETRTSANTWTDEAPSSGSYESRTVFRSKNVSYTSSTTDASMSGWTLYKTDANTAGKGDKIEYGRGNSSCAPAKEGAYRVWAEKINYTYNPDIYTRPTTDISIFTAKSDTNSSKIRWIQISLCRYGYNAPVDGVYGTATLAYVKKFQEDNGITATGIFGRATLQKMEAKLEADPEYCYYYETAVTNNTYNYYKMDAQWSNWTTTAITGDSTFNAGVTTVLVESKTQYRIKEATTCKTIDTEDNDEAEDIEAPEFTKIKFKAKHTKVQLTDDPEADGYECTVVKFSLKAFKMVKKQANNDDKVSVAGKKTFTSKSAILDLKNLKKGKKYVMVARSFKYVDGEKVYSKYSSVKLVKIKK